MSLGLSCIALHGIVKRREDDGSAEDGRLFAAVSRRLLDHGKLALGEGQEEPTGPFGLCRGEGLWIDLVELGQAPAWGHLRVLRESFKEGPLLLGAAHREEVGFVGQSPNGRILESREDDDSAEDSRLLITASGFPLDHDELSLGEGQGEPTGPFGLRRG
jgi:hypothetical protein